MEYENGLLKATERFKQMHQDVLMRRRPENNWCEVAYLSTDDV